MIANPDIVAYVLWTLAQEAPDLYWEFVEALASVELPKRGPPGSPQNVKRVTIIARAYDEGLQAAWNKYLERKATEGQGRGR